MVWPKNPVGDRFENVTITQNLDCERARVREDGRNARTERGEKTNNNKNTLRELQGGGAGLKSTDFSTGTWGKTNGNQSEIAYRPEPLYNFNNKYLCGVSVPVAGDDVSTRDDNATRTACGPVNIIIICMKIPIFIVVILAKHEEQYCWKR